MLCFDLELRVVRIVWHEINFLNEKYIKLH